MKKITLLLFLFSFISNSQSGKEFVILKKAFDSYSKSIIAKNNEDYLNLIYPSLVSRNLDLEKSINWSEFVSHQISYPIKESKGLYFAIKNIAKPFIRNDIEYIIIDYISISEKLLTDEYCLEYIESNKNISSSNYSCNNNFKQSSNGETILFDIDNKKIITSYHDRVLAIKSLNSKEWKFIPKNIGVLFRLENENRPNLKYILPNRIFKDLIKKTGYNNVYN